MKFSKKGKVLSVQDVKRHSALLLVEDVGLEPRLRIPNAVCYHYTTSSMLVVDRGLEPAILCVRGRSPDHLEESTIIKARLLTEAGVEPALFPLRGNVLSI